MPLASPGIVVATLGALDPLDPLAAIPHIDSDEEDGLAGKTLPAAQGGASPGPPGPPHRECLRSGSVVPPKSIAELSDRQLSGGVQLPGVHDVTGRPLVLYDVEAAEAARVTTTELAAALFYFMAVVRRDMRGDGVTLLAAMDTLPDCEQGLRRLRALDEALCLLTTDVKLSSMLVCQTRPGSPTGSPSRARPASAARGKGVLPLSDVQFHILGDSVAQRNFLTDGALPARCGGTLRHNHAAWVAFYQDLEPFLEACQCCGRVLAAVMGQLADPQPGVQHGVQHGVQTAAGPVACSTPGAPPSNTPCNTPCNTPERPVDCPAGQVQEAESSEPSGLLHSEQSALCRALSQPALLRLRREGPRVLAKLRDYQDKLAHSEDVRLSLERAERLYAEVDRTAVRLEQLGESRRERLRHAARLRALREETTQVLSWVAHTGEDSLQRHANMGSTLPAIRQQELEFDKFYFVSMRHLDKGSDLLDAAGVGDDASQDGRSTLSDLARSLRLTLRGFSDRLEGTRERLEDTSRCFHLLDRALGWALDTAKTLSRTAQAQGPQGANATVADWKQLQHHLMAHPPPEQAQLAEMLQLARKLRNDRLLEQCKIAHSRCLETLEQIRALQCRVADSDQDVAATALQTAAGTLGAAPASNFPVGRRRSVGSTPGCGGLGALGGLGLWEGRSPTACTGTAASTTSSAASLGGDVLANIREEDQGPDDGHALSQASHGVNGSPSTDSGQHGGAPRCLTVGKWVYRDETLPAGFGCCSGGDASGDASPSGCSCSLGPQAGGDSGRGPNSVSSGGSGVLRGGGAHHGLLHHQDDGHGGHDADGPERHVLRRSCSWQYAAEPFDDDCNRSVASGASGSGSADSSTADEHKLGYSSSLVDHTTEPSEACPQSGEELDEQDEHGDNDREEDKGPGKLSAPVPVNSHLHTHASNLSLNSTGEPANANPANPAAEQQRKTQKTLLLIMREMIQTERDYVRSLEYVIENYIPELVREDIPQALRGQRNVIFGNIEKIFEFHSQLFLRELERCEKSPLSVGQSFLRHESKFYLYALYNKNKPKSDALMSEYGSIFFKSKQVELGDRMDLASYLLKPVQRMGKYALLLQQLLKSAGAHEQLAQQIAVVPQTKGQLQHLGQLAELAEADQMVRFQLRHGNDLLAMDSLRDCDVNVKEQGRLLRQNEFLVWQGKGKKCLRHVFLFEELILFSKARRFPDRKNLDLYIYKHSIKMTDIGLTARLGDTSTRFEIWFRKRKPHDIFTLQAATQDVKQAWTEDISQLLWKQALKNREVRLAEMSSMGIGNKPCLDIRPSADQISDRSVSIAQLSKGPRLRGSPSVPPAEGDRTSARRPHSVISVGSSSGASSSTSSSSSSSNASSSSNSSRSRPGDTSLCSAESGIISDMSEGGSSRWGSREARAEELNESNLSKRSERSDLALSPRIHNSETEDICIKL
ncbi:uncharacterized protein LOC117639866 [Thrips palmi]|uniref:Uncharacterized protein LOC117639866 n=1 Tax=Thrips palmi TaxID=161013 RepID=A0A6P8YD40_THRPL|nr:uncharacterized protein LOC117639866 [Thrips palmi]